MSVLATSPARSARKRKGEGHSRRAEILAAAERIFVEQGYEGATIRRIADEVGLSSTALYMHFSDKGEMLQEICRTAFEALIAGNRQIVADPAAPEVRLRRMLDAYVAFGFDNPNAYRLIYMTRPGEALQAQNAAQEVGGELFRSFGAVVAEVGAQDRLRADPRIAAQVLWAGVHGIVSLLITKPYFDWVERARLTDAMIDALFAGLLKP